MKRPTLHLPYRASPAQDTSNEDREVARLEYLEHKERSRAREDLGPDPREPEYWERYEHAYLGRYA